MVILLPTYKRSCLLPLVIQSVLQSHTGKIKGRIMILVVNNHGPDKAAVTKAIQGIKVCKPFQLRIIHRLRPVVAVESWFKAIFKHAKEGELVVMLGDDDFLLPSSLQLIQKTLIRRRADMLAADYYQRLYFSANAKTFVFLGERTQKQKKENLRQVIPFNFMPGHALPASFVSSHAYRNSRILRQAYKQAIGWCRSQAFAPWAFASGLLPTWMSFAIHHQGGKVVKLRAKTVVRGHLLENLLHQEYADGGNTTFYGLLACHMFFKKELHYDDSILKHNRSVSLATVQNGAIDLLLTSAVSFSEKQEALKAANLSWISILNNQKAWKNFLPTVIKKIPFVKGWNVRQALLMRGTEKQYLTKFLTTLPMRK